MTRAPDRPGRDVTLADVAAEVGLHPSTVSRALDPARASMVKAPTRQRILDAAERIGYRPNLAARSLMTGRTATVAVIAADLGNMWVTPIIHGIAGRLADEECVPVIAETGDDSDVLADLLDHMVARRVDAMIVLAARRQDREAIASAARSTPTVVAARPLFDSDIPVVREDAEAGGRLVADHLASLGHRRVSQLHGPRDVLNFPLRAEGFSAGVRDHGIEELELGRQAAFPRLEDGASLARHLLAASDGDLPTAVFAHNDLMAVGAIAALRDAGLRVPEDISVAGYNDMVLTGHLDPPLTTVRFPGRDVGRHAADVALRLVAGEQDVAGIQLAPTLVARSSTTHAP
jgi:LacI family transcriptional regulator